MLRSARRREAVQRPLREERGGAFCVATHTACFCSFQYVVCHYKFFLHIILITITMIIIIIAVVSRKGIAKTDTLPNSHRLYTSTSSLSDNSSVDHLNTYMYSSSTCSTCGTYRTGITSGTSCSKRTRKTCVYTYNLS